MEEGRYIITETGRQFAALVTDILKTEFDIPNEQVGLGMPGENSQLALCIFLYDIQKNNDMNIVHLQTVSVGTLRYPSSFYDLYYMLVPYSSGDLKYRAQEESRFLDILLRKLADIGYMKEGEQTEVALINPELEEKIRIWNALNQPLRTALYCKLGPVEILSDRTKEVKRVKDAEMRYLEKEPT